MNNRKEEHARYYLNNKARIDARNKKWDSEHDRKDYHRNWKLKKKFNLTIDEYNVILNKQNNCCAICSTHESEFDKRLAVDHCHTTGKVIPWILASYLKKFVTDAAIIQNLEKLQSLVYQREASPQ